MTASHSHCHTHTHTSEARKRKPTRPQDHELGTELRSLVPYPTAPETDILDSTLCPVSHSALHTLSPSAAQKPKSSKKMSFHSFAPVPGLR
mmetsp:Transcript_19240/g.30081  ORF Transcript_19240/g.30081 Transcript_19240/m.30081 type:complete len:91 (-) Transcript_19240:679-951(-)